MSEATFGQTSPGPPPALATVNPAPLDPPDGTVDAGIPTTRIAPAAPVLVDGVPQDWQPGEVTYSRSGRLRVIVGGVDRTWVRGKRTRVLDYSSDDPFGDGPARFEFSGATPFDELSWLKPGATVDVRLFLDAGGTVDLWNGQLITDTDNDDEPGQWIGAGPVYAAAALAAVQIILDTELRDLGTVIARALNGVVSRPYATTASVTTGVTTRRFGSPGQTVLDLVRELLAQSTQADGDQFTVTCAKRQPRIVMRDTTTIACTWRVGQAGVEHDLRRDLEDDVNVIYGYGIAPSGYAWMGWVYPNQVADDAPPYPNVDADDSINLGDTDADTDSGTGVSTFQQKARELGYNLTVDGVLNANDVEVVRLIQARYGILVDGSIGPQTWAATFAPGSGGDLSDAYRLPLAYKSEVMPHLYDAAGRIAGDNPAYNPAVMRVEQDIAYGQGITKQEAGRAARIELARQELGYAGTITASVSGTGTDLIRLRAGHNVKLLGHRGEDRTLHVSSARHNPEDGSVTLTVDERARDYLTVSQVLERNRESRRDIARRPGNTYRSSTLASDRVIPFDGESAAGFIPRHAVNDGLWNVLKIPVSTLGRVAQLRYRMESPAARFSIALFGAPITAADLVAYVGDPLAEGGTYKPYDAHRSLLENRFGFIEAWGEAGQAAGYHADPDAADQGHGYESRGAPVTGWLVDTGGFEYVSLQPPYLWLAEWSPSATFASGRIFPAPVV